MLMSSDMYLKNGESHSRGYSSAVDMWSLGVISFMLLFGQNPFSDPNLEGEQYKAALMMRATRIDVSQLLQKFQQRAVGDRPKDFVKNLLILDERKRMSSKAALAHDWFTNERNASNFQRLYQQATQGWKPRSDKLKTIKYVELPDENNEMSGHFKASLEAERLAQLLQPEKQTRVSAKHDDCEIPETPSWENSDDVILDVSDTADDFALGSEESANSSKLIITETAGERISERLRALDIDWEAIKESVPQPDTSDYVDLDDLSPIQSIEKEEGAAQQSTGGRIGPKNDKAHGQCELGYLPGKRKLYVGGKASDLGDGFEIQELQNKAAQSHKKTKLW
jgi:serine/threonine protein kinase